MSERRIGTRTAVVTQPNYVPWRGHLKMISESDVLIVLDDVQYTKRDWRNRNRILRRDKVEWLTIPVDTSGRFLQEIRETRISDPSWKIRHWSKIVDAYQGKPYFEVLDAVFSAFYQRPSSEWLVDELVDSLVTTLNFLGVDPEVTLSSAMPGSSDPSERLAIKCELSNVTTYLTSEGARSYLNTANFQQRHIKVEWYQYAAYAAYPQGRNDFFEHVSILDFIANVGENAKEFFAAPEE